MNITLEILQNLVTKVNYRARLNCSVFRNISAAFIMYDITPTHLLPFVTNASDKELIADSNRDRDERRKWHKNVCGLYDGLCPTSLYTCGAELCIAENDQLHLDTVYTADEIRAWTLLGLAFEQLERDNFELYKKHQYAKFTAENLQKLAVDTGIMTHE